MRWIDASCFLSIKAVEATKTQTSGTPPACEKTGPGSPRTPQFGSFSQGQRVGFGKRNRLKEMRDQFVLHDAGRRPSSRTGAFNGCETWCLQQNKMSRAVTVPSASGTIVIRDAKIMFEPSSYDGTVTTKKFGAPSG